MPAVMPLDDIRVLDLTHYTAGPYCTRMLADMGADVIKVERPDGGDPARQLPPFYQDQPGTDRSGLFLMLNTNKRSVTLDLASPRGRDLALALARQAHIVVENFRPGVLDRLGLGYEALSAVNPAVVLTSISNFGQTGPYRDWEGTDLTLLAMGNMIGFGDIDHEPVKTAGHAPTLHAGYGAALATAMGLYAAEASGAGAHIDVSIFETAAQSIDMRLGRTLGYQYNGRMAGRQSGASGLGSGVFPCADGYFTMTAGPALVHRTIAMIGREDLLKQPEWSTLEGLASPERLDEFNAYLIPWMLERTKRELRAACEQAGVLGGPLNTVADLLEDENFRHRGFFQTIDHPETGAIEYPGYNFVLYRDGEPMPPRRRAPLLGEHTDEVLHELLGLEEGQRAELRAERVI